ncbi:MAG: NfeD family protein [Candidatus Dormibacteria bacterium]|jgi:membrane protein implicated in regulation of membrane protease activity
MEWWIFWSIAAALLLAGEIHTQAFYLLFGAVGATVAAVLGAVGLAVWVQVLVGVGAAVGGVFAVRPPLKRAMEGRMSAPYRFPGLAGGLVGARAVTVDTVGDEHHPGHALLANERWLAITDAPAPLPTDTPVVVAAVRGTTLLVRASGAPRLQ